MIEPINFYESLLAETEALLAEVEQLLLNINNPEYHALDLDGKKSGLKEPELNKADAVMTSYLRMIEITRSLESSLNKIRSNEIACNGQINSLIEASEAIKNIMDGTAGKPS